MNTTETHNFRLGASYAVAQLKAFVVCEQSLENGDALKCLNRAELCRDFWRDVVAKAPLFDSEKECFVVVMLNRKNKVLGWNMVSLGSATAALAHPREMLRACLMANATAFICMHNHPSGDPAPSAPDLQVTRQIREAAKACDFEFLDHVVIGQAKEDPNGRGFFSFREAGLL